MKKEVILYGTLIAIISSFFAFEHRSVEKLADSQMIITDNVNIETLELNTSATVYLVESNQMSLKLEADPSLLQNISTEINNGNASVNIKPTYNPLKLMQLSSDARNTELNIYIYHPNAKNTKIVNIDEFNDVQIFENDNAEMISLKDMKLFHINKQSPKDEKCLSLDKSQCKKTGFLM